MATSCQIYTSEEAFAIALRTLEIESNVKFIRQRIRRAPDVQCLSSLAGYKIRFYAEATGKAPAVECDGTPFILHNSEVYECHQGPVHLKSSQIKGADHDYMKNGQPKVIKTKKLNCTACIRVRQVIRFPGFKMVGPFTSRRRHDVSNRLRETFTINTPREVYLYANINNQHQHSVGEDAAYTVPLDKLVIKKIKELAQEGHRDMETVRMLLQDYCLRELHVGQAGLNCKRFNPSTKDIRNHIHIAMNEMKLSTADSDRLQLQKTIDKLKEKYPEDQYSFKVLNGKMPHARTTKGSPKASVFGKGRVKGKQTPRKQQTVVGPASSWTQSDNIDLQQLLHRSQVEVMVGGEEADIPVYEDEVELEDYGTQEDQCAGYTGGRYPIPVSSSSYTVVTRDKPLQAPQFTASKITPLTGKRKRQSKIDEIRELEKKKLELEIKSQQEKIAQDRELFNMRKQILEANIKKAQDLNEPIVFDIDMFNQVNGTSPQKNATQMIEFRYQ